MTRSFVFLSLAFIASGAFAADPGRIGKLNEFIDLSSAVALVQPDGSRATLSYDGKIAGQGSGQNDLVKKVRIATDGSGLVTLLGARGSIVLGVAVGEVHQVDGLAILTADRAFTLGRMRILDRGGRQLISQDRQHTTCTQSDGQAGRSDESRYAYEEDDDVEFDFASGQGSISFQLPLFLDRSDHWTDCYDDTD